MPAQALTPEAYDLELMMQEIETEGCCIEPVLCVPAFWQRHTPDESVNWNWETVPFREESRNLVPNDRHGIYSFIIKSGLVAHPHASVLIYTGKADRMSFRDEFSRYFGEMRSLKRVPLSRWLYKCQDYLYFSFCPFENVALIDSEERKLNAAWLPPGNERFEGILNRARRAF